MCLDRFACICVCVYVCVCVIAAVYGDMSYDLTAAVLKRMFLRDASNGVSIRCLEMVGGGGEGWASELTSCRKHPAAILSPLFANFYLSIE